MNNKIFNATELLSSVHGFLSVDEAELLHKLACEVPRNGVIVEIGSFQGRSTIALGLGAKESGAEVYAIDPHEDFQENESTHYGMENHAALLRNLLDYDLAETVRVVTLESECVVEIWDKVVDLLWIDGSHEYLDVRCDLVSWEWLMSPNGKIAIHDSSGHFPDVTRALNVFLTDDNWTIVQVIDATTVLERIHV